jgi:glycogen debranching enzyme
MSIVMLKDHFLLRISLGLILILLSLSDCSSRNSGGSSDLAITFQGNAKIEVGGPYVGAEFHHSYMIPQRISFFYPVANSIDHSQDYWTRDTSFVAQWYLKIGADPAFSIGRVATKFELTPYSVVFHYTDDNYSVKCCYQFCQNKPAMVLTIQITNTSKRTNDYQLDSRLLTSIRTCQTYRLIDQAWSKIENSAIYTYFNDPDADSAMVFVANAGYLPTRCNSQIDKLNDLQAAIDPNEILTDKPVSQFVYQKQLKPGESMNIVQLIGSSRRDEAQSIITYLTNNYQDEVNRYEQQVNDKAYRDGILATGYPRTDHSVAYARAVIAANAHFLEDEIVPMPCPAEYNFFFTHDVLVTDLAAVNFDLARVRKDLEFIIRHADSDNIIPHAYYWRDGKYMTEYASSDNWNNFWLVQVSAKYFRHSGDREFIEKLYPYVSKSVERSLLTLEKDNLMWSYRPDWWDIGHNYGSRSYMTILAIKTLRDYNFISTVLGKNPEKVIEYAALADNMQAALVEKLWSDELNYLINYNDDGSQDKHYYIGSLLAAHYELLDQEKQDRLVQTAKAKLLDEKVGIYNVFPMDFHLLGDYYKFVGNEVGAKYYYANGGIWSQGNAWYAMALIANGEKPVAAEFIEQTMSFDGILSGPNGQPAYYEVRNANKDNLAEYGTVDKPQFLWAAAWYLNCLYQLYGVTENDWNIALEPFLEKGQKECKFTLYVGGQPLVIRIEGQGQAIQQICYDEQQYPSAVFPDSIPEINEVKVKLGQPKSPYLQSTTATLKYCQYADKKITISLKAYAGHPNESVIITPLEPTAVLLNGVQLNDGWSVEKMDGYFKLSIAFDHIVNNDLLVVNF